MADFGLVTFKGDIAAVKQNKARQDNPVGRVFGKFAEYLFKAGFFKLHLSTWLYYFCRKADFENGIKSVKLLDGVSVWVIELPFPLTKFFRLNRNFIENYIKGKCHEKGIKQCILPVRIRHDSSPNEAFSHGYISKSVLKALLVQMLESICREAGLRMENLEILLVHDNSDEIFSIVKMLEPYINYVAILTEEKRKEYYENKLSELFADTGLSFTVSVDCKNSLKNADIVINLGKTADISPFRLKRKSMLINLSEADGTRLRDENAVINGLAFEFTDKSFKGFVHDLRGLYSKKEICEMALAFKLGLNKDTRPDDMMFDMIRQEFKKGNCRIIGFEGHRGIVSIENMVRAII